uniref:ABC transporter permease n=1 Tax=Roseihalotalea indica TaxID=2867963 RepID=A0AA49JFS2_9BACT|nr:ABC transporter permease [Tunicatimonas sp. TK19036]
MPDRPQPPHWTHRLIARICKPELLPEIEGDLHELYQRWVQQYGRHRAKWLYILNIITFFRPFALRRKGHVSPITSPAMLRNYFLTAWRQVQKSKLHTAINVFGLAIGIAACLVIALTVQHEFSYDRHHPDGDRIYRITSRLKFADDWITNGGVSGPIPHAVRDEFTGLEAVAAFHSVGSGVSIPGKADFAGENEVVIAEPDFFQVFSGHQWMIGSPEQSLSQPYQVVLTASQAQKYFGDQDAVGQTLTYFDTLDFVVSGILQDNPYNTDLPYTDYLSFATIEAEESLYQSYGLDSWGSTNSNSLAFIKLSKETVPSNISEQFPALVEKYIAPEESSVERAFVLQPLSDVHFNVEYTMSNHGVAHKPTLYGLVLVALFLLLVASVNFVNLETARAVLRSREVGVRKVLGSSRGQLIQQFLGETFLITLLAGILSLGVAKLGVDFFAESLPPELSLSVLWKGNGWLLLLAIIGIVGLLAGTYPAWVLSAYSPVFALKNQARQMSGRTRKAYFRRALIVFQFAIAQIFILGTLMVGSQLHYLLNKDMGFRKDAIIHFRPDHWWQDTTQRRIVLANELRQLSGVSEVSLSSSLPAANNWSSRTIAYRTDTSEIEAHVYIKEADTSYLNVFNIELLAGRNYYASDTMNELLLNETAARILGFDPPNEAVGKLIEFHKDKALPVVGVVSDFHDGPLRDKLHPLMMGSNAYNLGSFNVLMATQGKQSDEVRQTLAQVEQAYKKIYPEESFEYEFYDDTIAGFYRAEERTARLINVATGLAIFISCLGLLGLVSFTTNQRLKEIGIRKVLGATVTQIIALFSQEFVGLVLVSFVVAAPIAWYFAQEWLAGFAYQTNIGIAIFLLTVISALTLALLTVGLRSWQAALANPVDSLRNE